MIIDQTTSLLIFILVLLVFIAWLAMFTTKIINDNKNMVSELSAENRKLTKINNQLTRELKMYEKLSKYYDNKYFKVCDKLYLYYLCVKSIYRNIIMRLSK